MFFAAHLWECSSRHSPSPLLLPFACAKIVIYMLKFSHR